MALCSERPLPLPHYSLSLQQHRGAAVLRAQDNLQNRGSASQHPAASRLIPRPEGVREMTKTENSKDGKEQLEGAKGKKMC